MEREGNEIHIETDEVRAGSSQNIVRRVLAISLLAAIVVLSAIWIFGAATGDHDNPADVNTAAGQQQAAGTGTDGIVSDGADELGDPVTDGSTQGAGRVTN